MHFFQFFRNVLKSNIILVDVFHEKTSNLVNVMLVIFINYRIALMWPCDDQSLLSSVTIRNWKTFVRLSNHSNIYVRSARGSHYLFCLSLLLLVFVLSVWTLFFEKRDLRWPWVRKRSITFTIITRSEVRLGQSSSRVAGRNGTYFLLRDDWDSTAGRNRKFIVSTSYNAAQLRVSYT